MLQRVLAEVRAASGPISIGELSRRTGVAPEVVATMLRHRAFRTHRRGAPQDGAFSCPDACGAVCAAGCPFIVPPAV